MFCCFLLILNFFCQCLPYHPGPCWIEEPKCVTEIEAENKGTVSGQIETLLILLDRKTDGAYVRFLQTVIDCEFEISSQIGIELEEDVIHPTFRPGPYAGESIPAKSPYQSFTTTERAQINRIGQTTGCHTCGTTNPRTKSGNFVPDHQPVSALNTEGVAQRLYPQCIDCSREQGLAVARELRKQRQWKKG